MRQDRTGLPINNPPPWEDITAYQIWQKKEGLRSIRGFFVEDLNTVEVQPWARKGVNGTFINLEGTGGVNDAYICEIPPGKSTTPQRHLFEEFIYVVSGRGATTVWLDENRKQTFEWGPGSLFSPPLNTWHQHFNGQGDKPARYMAVTSLPTVIDLFHNDDFIFHNDFEFRDRFSEAEDFFSGKGTAHTGRVWETNFIPDVASFKLQEWKERGAGGSNAMFEMADNSMGAHVSQFPVGTYKKGHRHGPGAHVVLLNGFGYSLLWKQGDDFTRVNWKKGSMFVPPDQWFHQHFNAGTEPARYLAIRWGGRKHRQARSTDMASVETSVKEGGAQIEYVDEDPRVYEIFKAELAKVGIEPQMAQFFPNRNL